MPVAPPRSSPPLESLREVVEALEAGGVPSALGGSGLLAALDLESHVRDWDLTTDAPLDQVRAALARFGPEHVGPNGIHTDDKLVLARMDTECIVGFSLRSGSHVVRLPTRVGGRWNGVPLGSPEVWTVAYALMGRPEKSLRLLHHLASAGADPGALDVMLGQPLPAELALTLSRLPRRGHEIG
jgi:hypothetical protein